LERNYALKQISLSILISVALFFLSLKNLSLFIRVVNTCIRKKVKKRREERTGTRRRRRRSKEEKENGLCDKISSRIEQGEI